jgi:hypothetical protein
LGYDQEVDMTTQLADFDVIVVGGGTAGSIAAIASARSGARTCLVEKSGHLGGTCFELANVTPFHNSRGEQIVRGLPQELIDRIIERRGACQGGHLPNLAGIGGSFTPVDPDIMKLVLFEMALDAGVNLWLHSLLIDTEVADNRVTGIRIHNKSGTQHLSAKTVVDATGDADIAVGAGARFAQDQPEASLNATLLFRVAGVDTDQFIADARQSPQKFVLLADPYLRKVKHLDLTNIMREVKDIYDCPYIYLANVVRDYIPRSDWTEWGITGEGKGEWGKLKPFGSRFSIMPLPHRRDVVTLNVTSITFDATNGAERSNAEVQGQRQLHIAMEILRRYIAGFRDCFLLSVAPAVSIRASRRIIGEYQLTRDDIECQARFPDSVARGSYPMSVQSLTQPNERQHLFVRDGGDYDIPYRTLIPEKVDGLLVAGRCLSATREAAGSVRMGAQCMASGHAAGVAAAMAARDSVMPRAVSVAALRETLRQQSAVF